MLASQRLAGVGWSRHTIPKELTVSRLCRVLLVAVVALGVAASTASAGPNKKKLGATLGTLWQTVIETPTPQNLFGGGGDPCVDLGGVVAPFAPALGSPTLTCTVKPGTKVFVAAWTSECSTLEEPPFFGSNEAELRACARAVDAGIIRRDVTLDGKAVRVSEVESGLLRLDLPADNIFGAAAGKGPLSVAHGWVALFHPLTPGTHEITLHITGTYKGEAFDFHNTTTIIVKPGR
jgi:hypothetical protein